MKADVSERQRVKLLADMIGYYRLCCPRIGGFKLFHLLEKDLGHAVTLGRDSFLKVYESKGFKLNPNKRRRTTDSNHVYKRYPNLIKGKDARYSNHIWVSDITYVWILGDVLYLHLVTDAYSHAVLGWCLSDSLSASHTTEALRMGDPDRRRRQPLRYHTPLGQGVTIRQRGLRQLPHGASHTDKHDRRI